MLAFLQNLLLRKKKEVNEFMKKKGEEGKLRSNFLVFCCERFYDLLVFIREIGEHFLET